MSDFHKVQSAKGGPVPRAAYRFSGLALARLCGLPMSAMAKPPEAKYGPLAASQESCRWQCPEFHDMGERLPAGLSCGQLCVLGHAAGSYPCALASECVQMH